MPPNASGQEKTKQNGAKDRPGKSQGSVVEEVCKGIKMLISYNMLAPGQKLIYRDIAERLNVSNTPVVQALKALEHSNFVRHEPNKGYFVAEITVEEAIDLFQAREALEVFCVPLIMKNITAKKQKSIRDTIKSYRSSMVPEQRRRLMPLDAEFHMELVSCSGNIVITRLLSGIFEQITLKYRPEYLSEDRILMVSKEHSALLRSLGEGDVEKTTELVRAHIQRGREHIVGSLQRNRVGLQLKD